MMMMVMMMVVMRFMRLIIAYKRYGKKDWWCYFGRLAGNPLKMISASWRRATVMVMFHKVCFGGLSPNSFPIHTWSVQLHFLGYPFTNHTWPTIPLLRPSSAVSPSPDRIFLESDVEGSGGEGELTVASPEKQDELPIRSIGDGGVACKWILNYLNLFWDSFLVVISFSIFFLQRFLNE